jgi:HAD superfamily hydrolase (TIGR01493 family)
VPTLRRFLKSYAGRSGICSQDVKAQANPGKAATVDGSTSDLKAFPDVPSLKSLKDVGVKLAFLSNLPPHMLESVTKSSGLEGIFEHSLSTDAVKIYKPDPRAYQMSMDAFMLQREEILFAAFGGRDAAGAKMFGYTTFWVNRLNLPVEELDVVPDGMSRDAYRSRGVHHKPPIVVGYGERIDQLAVEFFEEGSLRSILCVFPAS